MSVKEKLTVPCSIPLPFLPIASIVTKRLTDHRYDNKSSTKFSSKNILSLNSAELNLQLLPLLSQRITTFQCCLTLPNLLQPPDKISSSSKLNSHFQLQPCSLHSDSLSQAGDQPCLLLRILFRVFLARCVQ